MVQFRFSQDAPDAQMMNDFQQLGGMNEQQLGQFIDIIISFFAGQQPDQLMGDVNEFSSNHGINPNALRNIIRAVLIFFKGAIRANLTPLFVKEDLINFGLSDAKASVISVKWKTNFVALSRSVIGQTLIVNNLLDMTWRFGALTSETVTTANSDLKKVGSTYLQLQLVLDAGNNTKQNVFMELTLPQFYQFVHDMEQAKAHLEYFS